MKQLFLLITCTWPLLIAAQPDTPAPAARERMLQDLVKRADGTWLKLQKPSPSYGCRELFTSMLAYAESRSRLARIAELLTLAERMQNREPGHPAYGNFRWYSRDADVLDFNAVDFCMQHGALLWRFHRDALDPDTRDRLLGVLEPGLQGLIRHRPKATYTNIALLNASDLILLGQALENDSAVNEGERRLALIVKTLWEEGVHEFVSPTYYGVDIESVLLLEALAEKADTRSLARTLATFFWHDVALNWFAPAQRLAGAHSRTYDYVYGYGELDQLMTAAGWLPLTDSHTFSSFTPLYARCSPPLDLWRLSTTRTPRLVEQTWGADPFCSRSHYVCGDVTLSTAWKAYHGRMDIPLTVDLPGTRADRLPRLSFIPDGRSDPYGTLRISDGKTHAKAFHLSPWWAGVQDTADALGVAVYRDSDFKDATGTLESHLLFRKKLDALLIDNTPATFTANRPSICAVPPGAAVFLRSGTAAVGIRVPWTRGQDGSASPVNLVDDHLPNGALRLTVAHAWLQPSNHASRVQAGAAFWLRIGSGLTTDTEFVSFRKAFCAATAEVQVTRDRLGIRVSGLTQPLSIGSPLPAGGAPDTSPQPPRLVLAVDGRDLGREILERDTVVQTYLRTRKPASPVEVASDAPTVWEAEHAQHTVPYEIWTNDASAAEGAYLWVPECEGQSGGGGGGRAVYTLHAAATGRFTLACRVMTPTPDDDSFFLESRAQNGRAILTDSAWSPGVFTSWTWREVTLSGSREPAVLVLPQGESTLTLRPRESGAKIDQLRLTPSRESPSGRKR